jgi:hypothetical protein
MWVALWSATAGGFNMGPMNQMPDDSSDSRLTHGLLSAVASALFAGALDAQLTEMLRETFRTRMPAVDVSDDVALGRAVENLAIRFRDQV